MLLLSALVVGLGNVWATDVTYKLEIVPGDFTTVSYADNNGSHSKDAVCTTDGSKTMSVSYTTNQIMQSSSLIQWKKSEGYIYNTTDLGTISSVTITSTDGTFTTYYGTSEQPSSGVAGSGKGYFKTSVGSATGKASKIEVTFVISESDVSTPTISVNPTSLSGFTYEVGSGPSEAKSFSVSGSNLTANISLSLGESNYEMSLTEGSGYTNSLTLTQTAGAVAATTIYVRLKSGLAINASYGGTITLTSTGATNKTVTLAGSVIPPCFSWDLSHDITETATKTSMTWKGTAAAMAAAKGSSSTNTNNYYPGSGQSSTRFYTSSTLTITPVTGYSIAYIVFTATTNSYANTLAGSTWTNATAAADGTSVTVTPTTGTSAVSATIGGTCGFTEVKVYYTGSGPATTTVTLAAACTDGDFYYGTYSNSRAFVVPSDIIVSEIKVDGGSLQLTDYDTGDVVPANTGVLITSDEAGDHTLTYSGSAGTSKLGANNMLKPSGDMGISVYGMNEADTKFYRLTMHGGSTLGFYWGAASGAAFKLTANKAYLAVPTGAPVKEFISLPGFEDDVDAINSLTPALSEGEGAIYNLAGQRLQKMQKGINIVNGKKVLY